MRNLWPHALLALAALPTYWARAEEPQTPAPIPAAEQKTLEQFGEANKACVEWSDGCVVCVRQTNGTATCSLPGIACEPGSLSCRDPSPPKPADKPEATKPQAAK